MPKIGSYDSEEIHPEDRMIGTEGDPLGQIGSTKNHSVDKLYLYTKQRLTDEGFSGGGGAANTVTNYRSSFEADLYIYDGFLLNTTPTIRRRKDNTTETAQGVTDLETDWTNRLSLTYN